jgi:hypothetical protein
LFLQVGNGGMAAALGHRCAAARLRLSGLATPSLHRFAAWGVGPFHLGLQFSRRTLPYHSIERRCASQQNRALEVRNGSEADILGGLPDVRFTPTSGHQQAHLRRPLCAKTGSRLVYSITSSAISRKSREIVRPSAFAVLRLMASSNLLGCSTGRSEGFAPLRTLATIAPSCSHIAGRLGP